MNVALLKTPYMLASLDLFSGIGGFSLAFRGVLTTVAYCEIDPQCRRVLENAMHRGFIDTAPIFEDVQKLTPSDVPQRGRGIRVITAGFPCQDISSAAGGANRKGIMGERSSLFAQVVRLARDLPSVDLVVLENSPNIVNRGEDIVVSAFNDIGFDVYCSIYAATDVLALHIRKRWVAFAVKRGRLSHVLKGLPSQLQKVHTNAHVESVQKQLGAFWDRWETLFPPCRRLISKQQSIAGWGTGAQCLRVSGMFGNSVVPQMLRLTLVIMCYIWNKQMLSVERQSSKHVRTNKDQIVEYTTTTPHADAVHPKPTLVPRPPLMFPIFDGKGTRYSQYFYTPVRSDANYRIVKTFSNRSQSLLGTQIFYMMDNTMNGDPAHAPEVHPKPTLKPRPPFNFRAMNGKHERNASCFHTPVRSSIQYAIVRTPSYRALGLLGTQLYHMHRDKPCSGMATRKDAKYVNPEFVEFLMGFPSGYLTTIKATP